MTLDPNAFLPTALSGKAGIITDPTSSEWSQIGNILGSANNQTATVAGPTTVNAVAACHFVFKFPTGAATATFTVTTPDAIEIVDVITNKIGTGGGTVQVQNSAGTAISDATAYAADKTLYRAATIDATTPTNQIAAGGQFKVVNTYTSGTVQANVTVICRRL